MATLSASKVAPAIPEQVKTNAKKYLNLIKN
jgi:hypothetical protein